MLLFLSYGVSLGTNRSPLPLSKGLLRHLIYDVQVTREIVKGERENTFSSCPWVFLGPTMGPAGCYVMSSYVTDGTTHRGCSATVRSHVLLESAAWSAFTAAVLAMCDTIKHSATFHGRRDVIGALTSVSRQPSSERQSTDDLQLSH
jgi:hypothetical protein